MHASLNTFDLVIDPARRITICRPGPGFRLAFLSIPLFLKQDLKRVMTEAYRTSPPLCFTTRDFREPFLSAEEMVTLNRFKALKKQVEWMAGRYAAKQLGQHFLEGQPPPADTRLSYRPKGAPYFIRDPARPLSISHAGDYAVAGLGLRPYGALGLDLEKIRSASRYTLLRAAFSEREAKVLQALDDEALFLRWTAKEAYLKTIGQGFHESLKKIEILDGTIFHGRRPVAGLTLQSGFPCPGYAFSLVY
jgi:4'-phosphopantetheinyl transferase